MNSLKRIGCSETAVITQRAIDSLCIDGTITADAIERVIERAMEKDDEDRDDRLNECDDQYYEKAGDLAGPLLEFIKNNRDHIVLNG